MSREGSITGSEDSQGTQKSSSTSASLKSLPILEGDAPIEEKKPSPDSKATPTAEVLAAFKALKRKKSARKGVITRVLTDVRLKAKPSSHEYEYVLSALNRYKQEIITIDQEILSLHEDFKFFSDKEYDELLSDNEAYMETIDINIIEFNDKLTDLLKQKEDVANLSFMEALKSVSQSSNVEGNHDSEIRAKLPTLQVDTFDGDRSKYQSFIDKFESLVGNKDYISDVDKFGYLLSYLRGRAKRLVEFLPVVSTSYATALSILEKNYVNKEEIIYDLALRLINLKLVSDSYDDLYNFYCEMEGLLGQMNTNKLNLVNSAWIVQTLIFEKLPLAVKKMFQQKTDCIYPSLDKIRDEFPTILSLYKIAKPDSTPRVFKNNSGKSSFQNKSKLFNKVEVREPIESKPSTLKSFNHMPANEAPAQMKCKFCCSTEHSSTRCSKYPSYESRVQRCVQINMCQKCTGTGHAKEKCRSVLKFKCLACGSDQHVLSMCDKSSLNEKPKSTLSKQKNSKAKNDTLSSHVCLSSVSKNADILLPTITLEFKDTKGELEEVRCLIDTCSQQSFVTRKLVEKLNLPIHHDPNPLYISTFVSNDSFCTSNDSANLPLVLEGMESILEAVVVDRMDKESLLIPGLYNLINQLQVLYPIADKHITSDFLTDIQMLIGADYVDLVHKGVLFVGEGIAICTPRGIAPLGHISKFKVEGSNPNVSKPIPLPSENLVMEDHSSTSQVVCINNIMQDSVVDSSNINNLFTSGNLYEDSVLEEGIQQLWLLESVGIKESTITDEDQLMVERFTDTIEKINDKYFVELPWKVPCPELEDNLGIAKGHLMKNYEKLKSNDRLVEYDMIIKEQLDLGFIEEVEVDSLNINNCHYLTHRGVYKEDSATTKLRIVYNCSQKDCNHTSLNDCLIEGPNLVSDLVQILLRFRLEDFALQSDISKAFLRVNLKLEYDKNHLRFLWFKDPSDPSKGMVTYRFKVVLFGANCSPCLLHLTIQNHLDRYPDSSIIDFLKQSFYVDNLIGSAQTEKDMLEIYQQSMTIMKQGNFTLREWISNSPELNSLLKETNLGVSELKDCNKTLGMSWTIKENTINNDTVSTKSYCLDVNACTKRNILSESSKVFDPLGLFLPATIRSRIFLQGLWKKKAGWDDRLEEEDLSTWKKLAVDLNKVQNIHVKRCSGYRAKDNFIHIFTDASVQAYGCCAYLVNSKESNLIYAKAKVAPLKIKRTIPQLELLAISLAAKTAVFLIETYDFDVKGIYIWSDSKVCLTWVTEYRSSSCKNIFVKNRLMELEKVKNNVDLNYRYVETKSNPADFLSRGLSYRLLKSRKAWFQGPLWLTDVSKWESNALPIMTNVLTHSDSEEPLFDVEKYSDFGKVIRITSYCLKFMNNCLNKIGIDRSSQNLSERATKYWLIHLQKAEFPTEISYFGENPGKIPPLVSDLNLFLASDGLLRCKGRVNKSELTYNAKNPILLPRNTHLTRLLIRDTHNKVHHMGISQTLNELRKTYWIPKGRATVKSVLEDCKSCKRINARPFKTPNPPDLPVERVKCLKPFTTVGIDYTGALNVTFSSVLTKVYIVLFTCPASRAICLDIVEDLSAESFVAAFRRFCARYDVPKNVWCDNATYFKSGEKIINNLIEHEYVNAHFLQNKITWKYIPVNSPWYGSIWERSIQTVKNCLKKTVGNKHLQLFELMTLLQEIEFVVNSRPLTYVGDNIDDLEPLTPNHLLKGQTSTLLPEHEENVVDPNWEALNHTELNLKYTNRKLMKDRFFSRWSEDYLVSLRDRHKNLYNKDWNSVIQVGDIVLIHNTTPRLNWSLGRVLETCPGDDGVVRVVRLKTASGETTRDISLLFPLECSLQEKPLIETEPLGAEGFSPPVLATSEPEFDTLIVDDSDLVPLARPTRKTALKAREFLKQKIECGDL